MTLDTDSTAGDAASWPANDPATWRTVPETSTPLDPARIQTLLAAEWERFGGGTAGSAAHHQRAVVPMPLGVASSFHGSLDPRAWGGGMDWAR